MVSIKRFIILSLVTFVLVPWISYAQDKNPSADMEKTAEPVFNELFWNKTLRIDYFQIGRAHV